MSYLQQNHFRSFVTAFVFAFAVVGVLFSALPARAQTSVNLFTDPGFESNPLGTFVGVFSGTQNVWGAENGSIVGTTGSITPLGSKMLQMLDDGLTVTQTAQLVAVPTAFVPSIDAGNTTVDMSAFFNVTANAPNAVGSVLVEFLDGSAASLGFLSNNSSSLGPNGLDVNSLTWENVLLDNAPVPSLTRFLRAQVLYNNASMAGNPGSVDNADLRISIVPEPSTFALAALGLVGMGWRRRKRA